jgi:hypothetical protein
MSPSADLVGNHFMGLILISIAAAVFVWLGGFAWIRNTCRGQGEDDDVEK